MDSNCHFFKSIFWSWIAFLLKIIKNFINVIKKNSNDRMTEMSCTAFQKMIKKQKEFFIRIQSQKLSSWGYYLPPVSFQIMDFLREIWDRKNELFKLSEISIMKNVPRYLEIDRIDIWNSVKKKPKNETLISWQPTKADQTAEQDTFTSFKLNRLSRPCTRNI